MERSLNILLDGLNQCHGANLALNSDVDQVTLGKVKKQTLTLVCLSYFVIGNKVQ